MVRRTALVAALLLPWLPAHPVSLAESPEDAARAAAESWLNLMDCAQYAASWEQSAAMLRRTVGLSEWERIVGAERSSLGKVVSRRLKSRRYAERVLGASPGRYVILEYDTTFEHRTGAVETVVPMVDPDGAWRVFAFFVR
jgi:serine/threonine-protein kinase